MSHIENAEKSVYKREPLKITDGIPVFSETDKYIANYEQIASDHIEHFDNTGENPFINEALWSESETDTIKFFIDKLADCDVHNVLDVGVGTGRLLNKLRQYMPEDSHYYGIDIAYSYIERASKTGIECCLGKIEDMPYREEVFDLVLCADVLEHVLDLQLCTTKIINVIKKGGYLVIRVPYKEDLRLYVSPDSLYEFAHLRNFDEDTLKILFSKINGLTYINHKLSGYNYSNARAIHRFPKHQKYLSFGFRCIRRLKYTTLKALHLTKAYKRFVRRNFIPTEIIMVFRKDLFTA